MKLALPVRKVSFYVLVFLLAACSRHDPSEFQVEGLPKTEVLQQLGEPPHETLLNGKQINSSMGPKPKFANTLADDDIVEMWQYRVTDNRAAQLYFNEDGLVAEVIIYPTDVMY